MGIARVDHTATLLPDGRVLAAGGDTDPAELYDPASGTWAPTGALNEARHEHTATLLPNGKVLVAAGAFGAFNLQTRYSAELYDPSTGAWTFTGQCVGGGGGAATATLLPNGKVLKTGGYNAQSQIAPPTYSNSAELYDPASGTWSLTASLGDKRAYHTATLLLDGKVLVAGGFDGTTLATAELYDPATGTWTATGNLNEERFQHTATLLASGKVLVAGGGATNAELYDPATGIWTLTGALREARAKHSAVLLSNHKVLVTGGRNSSGSLATAELYDPTAGTWTPTGTMHQSHWRHTATILPDKQVLIAGGGGTDARGAELYTEPPTPPSLLNISTRLHIQTGDNAMIGGFIITGTQTKTVLVRGIGPSLSLPGALTDPVIEVHGPSGELLGTNDNWKDALTRQQIEDSGLAPTNDLESALWGTINPGAYTVVVRGKDNSNGIGLFEVYDLDQSADSTLANVSTRGVTQTNDDVMIGGITVGEGTDGATAKVVVRAIGPSLPVAGALADPTVELRDGNGTLVAFNDDWKTRPDGSSQQAEIEATTIPPANDLESALVQMLPPDRYTAIVRGKNDASGVGLIEFFNLR
jgi:hypothetical protein